MRRLFCLEWNKVHRRKVFRYNVLALFLLQFIFLSYMSHLNHEENHAAFRYELDMLMSANNYELQLQHYNDEINDINTELNMQEEELLLSPNFDRLIQVIAPMSERLDYIVKFSENLTLRQAEIQKNSFCRCTITIILFLPRH